MKKTHLAALTLLAAACSGDLPPRSVLQDLRVLALLATPLEAGPSDSVSVRAVTFVPGGGTTSASLTETWSFCPFTIGATASDLCAVPQCETPLTPVNGAVTENPGTRAQDCLTRFRSAGAVLPAGLPAQVPPRLEVLFRYVASAPGFESREAVLRVPLYPGGVPAAPNAAPKVTALAFGGEALDPGLPPPTGSVGTVPKGGQLEVRVVLDPLSVQQYQDSSGRTVSEQLFVSFYTTDGRFDFDRGVGLDENVNLKDDKVANRAVPANVYAVAHDDRGGATVLGPYTVSFTR